MFIVNAVFWGLGWEKEWKTPEISEVMLQRDKVSSHFSSPFLLSLPVSSPVAPSSTCSLCQGWEKCPTSPSPINIASASGLAFESPLGFEPLFCPVCLLCSYFTGCCWIADTPVHCHRSRETSWLSGQDHIPTTLLTRRARQVGYF